MTRDFYHQLGLVIANYPADIRIECSIYNVFPQLRSYQYRDLLEGCRNKCNEYSEPSSREIFPELWYPHTVTTAAFSMLLAHLYSREDVVANFYKLVPREGIERLWNLAINEPKPGLQGDIAASRLWEDELGLSGLVRWSPLAEVMNE